MKKLITITGIMVSTVVLANGPTFDMRNKQKQQEYNENSGKQEQHSSQDHKEDQLKQKAEEKLKRDEAQTNKNDKTNNQ